MRPKLIPVIHVAAYDQVKRNARVCLSAGVDGIAVIDHFANLRSPDTAAMIIREQSDSIPVLVNYLGLPIDVALVQSQSNRFCSGLWCDDSGICAGAVSPDAVVAQTIMLSGHAVFAGIAFKGQRTDVVPWESARIAIDFGFIPTTSGAATGLAPSVEKLRLIRQALHPSDPLAVASGVSAENVAELAPFVTHIFVATSIGADFYNIDPRKLERLMHAMEMAS